ncbi:thymidine phosphorylase [Engelhardtia mirabilis]|uniref:thymidine phosphorylase n=1 Tax=Engelhardtia mirabilis TaxID=2528011 RepID=A0A518BDI0_9BACT|nr:Pyrimidine-nucleoside phosphorylase [Planctomycetes bacterium Pla133]QDU99365.1 Pyrimidine-nucleoside phosphorylase [Planctomycetes bacterium Pla86]
MSLVLDAITTKRDGGTLSPEQVDAFLSGYVAGDVPDYQAAALLMAILLRGMERDELALWTRAMLASGTTLQLDGLSRPRVDKHSTGGIGDKASIPLAPAVAACGAAVPMISGRGLGHTGGTLDKLESIPGLSTDVAPERFRDQLERCGVVFAGQTADIVPADKQLYALRDVTGTVESIPLISSSILSKKLAEGIEGLVLDVKFGSGAFISDAERGSELARTMVDLAGACGLRAVALQTYMGRPLGRAVGHSLEIAESLDCLRGGGPDDLRQLVAALGGEMLTLGGLSADADAGAASVLAALDDGRALESFRAVVAEQGGDPASLDSGGSLPRAPELAVLEAESAGWLGFGDLRDIGRALAALGGGRERLGDRIDPAVGFVLQAVDGDRVEAGQPLVEIHHRGGAALDAASALLRRALQVRSAPHARVPLLRDRLA